MKKRNLRRRVGGGDTAKGVGFEKVEDAWWRTSVGVVSRRQGGRIARANRDEIILFLKVDAEARFSP